MNNFWGKFNKPILAMAPMAGITDSAFRQVCKSFGADVLYSEMASVTALVYAPQKTLELLAFQEIERPYVVQLFGSNPEHFVKATKIVTEKIKPDGIDLNFGCPVNKIQKQGAGAVLMKDKKKAYDCIKATIDNTDLPVSIKTRTQVADVSILDFLDFVSSLDVKALMIHGRTLAQGFAGEIDTEIIKKAKSYFGGIILANGGINNWMEAERILQKTESDGLGLARWAVSKPYLFQEIKEKKDFHLSSEELKKLIKNHAKLVYELKGGRGIIEFRKILCAYLNGLVNAKKIREKAVAINDFEDVLNLLKEI